MVNNPRRSIFRRIFAQIGDQALPQTLGINSIIQLKEYVSTYYKRLHEEGCQNSLLLITAMIIVLSAPNSLSLAETPQSNIRETCRKRVSGIYLSTFDKNERAKDLVTVSGRKIKELQASIRTSEATLKRQEKKANREKFDMSLNTAVDQTKTRLKSLRSALADQTALRNWGKADSTQAQVDLRLLKKNISKVFKFLRISGPGYQFSIVYKNKCDQFRFVCPLPRASRELLLKIFPKEQTPDVCLKYAGHFR